MSRTFKDRPYRILYAQSSGRSNATHEHQLFGSSKTVPVFVFNTDGTLKVKTQEVIFHSSSVNRYNETLGLLYGKVEKTTGALKIHTPDRHPDTHQLEIWEQEVKPSSYGMFHKYTIPGIEATNVAIVSNYTDYSRWYTQNDTHVLIRKTITVPVIEQARIPYYEDEVCTIDVPHSPENNWGWALPCGHWGADVYRTGHNGLFARTRKKREKRRNRYTAVKETNLAVKYYNSNIGDETFTEEADEVLTLTAHTLRKKGDWD